MSEPVIVNSVTVTEDLFRQAVRKPLGAKYDQITKKVALILASVMLVLWLIAHFMKAGQVFVGEIVIACAVLIWVRLFLPRSERKRAYARFCRGSARRTTAFYEDRFTVTGGEQPAEFTRDDIASIRTTADLILIKLTTGPEVFLSRSGFEKGSEEALNAWLEEA